MNKDILNYIRSLSIKDKKTNSNSSQKLKTSVFSLKVNINSDDLKECGFEFEKVEVEYAIYDTNVSHDTAWINQI